LSSRASVSNSCTNGCMATRERRRHLSPPRPAEQASPPRSPPAATRCVLFPVRFRILARRRDATTPRPPSIPPHSRAYPPASAGQETHPTCHDGFGAKGRLPSSWRRSRRRPGGDAVIHRRHLTARRNRSLLRDGHPASNSPARP
jgi:hypothetical protein